MDETDRIGADGSAAPGLLGPRAAAFLDLWERQVSEHARRGPQQAAAAEDRPAA